MLFFLLDTRYCILDTMRYLGIDYGTKRIGLALSDQVGDFSYPYLVLENKGIYRVAETIATICKKEQVTQVVIGESKDYKGKENAIMAEVHQFVAELEEKTELPIDFENEILSSAEAERIQGSHRMLDASAAAVILRTYLERIKQKRQASA